PALPPPTWPPPAPPPVPEPPPLPCTAEQMCALQRKPVLHTMHASPFWPHASLPNPVWHVPLWSQQPPQLPAPHTLGPGHAVATTSTNAGSSALTSLLLDHDEAVVLQLVLPGRVQHRHEQIVLNVLVADDGELVAERRAAALLDRLHLLDLGLERDVEGHD